MKMILDALSDFSSEFDPGASLKWFIILRSIWTRKKLLIVS